MKKSIKICISSILIILLLAAAVYGIILFQAAPVQKTADAELVRVEIPSGTSIYKVSVLLKDKGLIKNQKLFYLCARFPFLIKLLCPSSQLENTFVLKSGIYHIANNLNYVQLQTLLSSGQQEFVKVSVPEGLTISKIGALLEENRVCSARDFIDVCHNQDLIDEYGIPSESLEGYLFPDTYFFNLGMEPARVAGIMADNFFSKIKSVKNLSEMNAAQLFETVTLASIVEREYRIPEEAPLIASVFKNRLRKNIGLYSCATLEYIITEIEGLPHPDKILTSDTKIDNPYNTYKWAGLPPGPISNPGLISLNAATNTPKTSYYFFQIVDPEKGRHVFNETFEEHIENHNMYTKK